MAKHQFLSDSWFDEVHTLVETHGTGETPGQDIMVNLVITETPFGDDRQIHMGSQGGTAQWGQGHADAADVTLTVDYATAKDIFVSGNPQAGMQAFMQGKVKVQGDMTKLMAMQQVSPDPATQELQGRIQEVTA